MGRRTLAIAAGLLLLFSNSAPAVQGDESHDQKEEDSESERFYSSPYLPLQNWVYPYVDVLIARGRLKDLAILVQPYRRIDIARAILEAEAEGSLSEQELAWAAEIRDELRREFALLEAGSRQKLKLRGEFRAGFEAVSQLHRDLLRPTGDAKFFPTWQLEVLADAPAVAGSFQLRWNQHYNNDPQFPDGEVIQFRECDPIVQQCAYRIEEAYVEVQIPYVRIFFGRMYRNWGLPAVDGLLLSDYQYSYDHIGYRFGSDRISLTGLYAPFNDFGGDTARHFSSHRFDWQIRDNLAIALGESVVYGGENRRIEFSLTNPIAIWEINGRPNDDERNALGMAEVWWRPYSSLVTYGAFLVDNTSVGDEEQGKTSGFNQYALALGAQLPTVAPTVALRGDLTIVSALAYRSRIGFFEYYTLGQAGYGIGLAQDRTDAIIVSLLADWFARPRLYLQPGLALMWKGEDDITDPWPPGALGDRDKLLVGTVETTIRPYLGGNWHARYGDVRWNVGLNFIENRNHQPQDWQVEFVGSVWAEARVRF